jgi:hypothetical protein
MCAHGHRCPLINWLRCKSLYSVSNAGIEHAMGMINHLPGKTAGFRISRLLLFKVESAYHHPSAHKSSFYVNTDLFKSSAPASIVD